MADYKSAINTVISSVDPLTALLPSVFVSEPKIPF